MIILILPIALLLGTAVAISAAESPDIYRAIKRKAVKRKRLNNALYLIIKTP